MVTEGGGVLVANERMGRRRLAYPIAKQQDGVYIRFLYDADTGVPKELERRVRLTDRVLRSLTVRLEEDWAVAAKEQAVRDAQARAEAAERERLEREAGVSGATVDAFGGRPASSDGADERDPDLAGLDEEGES